jgi:tetratricopeptide (TPR) repeat protein
LFVISLNAFGQTGAQADEASYAEVRNDINRGNMYLSRNLFQQAIEEYQKSLDLDPGNSYARSNIVLAHNNWGIFYYQQGKYELAKEQWETALRLSPNDRKAKYNLSICQQAMARQGKSTQAETPPIGEATEAKEKPPESAVVILNASDNAKNPDPDIPPLSKQNSDAFVETPPPSKENALAQKTHESKPAQPEALSNPPLDSYSDSGIESGAKLLPRKHNDSEAVPKIDESINRLETKIYGQPRSETSVLRRLERMELDSFGKVNDAPITERIAKLKRLFSVDD